jgi:O-antigen/teichoic acid export membrane protein
MPDPEIETCSRTGVRSPPRREPRGTVIARRGPGTAAPGTSIQTEGPTPPRRVPSVAQRLLAVLRGDALTRSSALLVGDYLVIGAIGAVCSVIAARSWSAHDIGAVASVMGALSLISTAASTGVSSAITRFLGIESDQRGFVLEALLFTASVAIALDAAVCFVPGHFGVPIHNLGASDPVTFALMASFSAAAMTVNVVDPAFLSRTEVPFTVAKDVGASIIRVAILLALIGTTAVGLFGTAIGYSAAAAAIDLGLVFWRLRRGPSSSSILRLRTLRRRARFAAGSHSAALVSAIPGTVGITIIAAHLGATDAAYVAIPVGITAYITIIPTMTAQAMLAELRHEDADPALIGVRGLRLAYAGTLPMIALMFGLAHYVLLIYGAQYAAHGVAILRWAALAGLVSTFNYMGDTLMLGRQKMLAYNFANISGSLGILIVTVTAVALGFRWLGPSIVAGQLIYASGSIAMLLRHGSIRRAVDAARLLHWRP